MSETIYDAIAIGSGHNALVELITDREGVILCDRQVERVIVRDGKAVGVRTQDGEHFHASHIIAGVNPDLLYHQLLALVN